MRTPRSSAYRSVYASLVTSATTTVRSFSASGRLLFMFFAGLLIVSSAALLYLVDQEFLVVVPTYGGSLSEGIIGAPRFINPVLAVSDADRDLSSLVYSGLLKATPDGDYVPDLAESYAMSPDAKTYTFIIRKGATFQDGTPVTVDDVAFTISKTQDAELKSPERANWNGVTVSKIDDRTIEFTLKEPYAPFIENLTLGILPKHLWQDVSTDEFPFSDLNISPIGSGPFRVRSISKTSSGIPSSYTLTAFDHYALGRAFLDQITLHFYKNEEGLTQGLTSGGIEAANSISPSTLKNLKDFSVQHSSLNRVFGVFFNQNQSATLRDNAVRHALNDAIDRDALVTDVLGGYGTPLTEPVPPSILHAPTFAKTTHSGDPALLAKNELLQNGWVTGPDGYLTKTIGSGKKAQTVTLTFSLATGNVPELRSAAEHLRASWQKMGAKVDVQVFNQGDLSQNVIRPRKYDALLFGEIVGRELDLFAFWDSSQRIDPGLNIALYANSTADKILERLRTTSDKAERQTLYQRFNSEIQNDMPAVFLYAPDFVYIVPKDVLGLNLGFIETPSDRFLSVTIWHRETDRVWPLFKK